jgi:hypothetical protein
MRSLARVALLSIVVTSPAFAQSANTESRPFAFSLALGPTHTFRGVDAPGVQGQGGIAHRFGNGLGLRLEGTGHWYESQPLYPCIVQDAVRCYQTIRRAVAAGTLNATYHISRFRSDKVRTVPYLISGIGIYRSRRIATHYPDCQPVAACADRNTYKLEMRDTQFGWSGGVGLDLDVGPVASFAEIRLHYMYNNKPGGQPSNDYFLWPLSLGFRF